MSKNRADIRGAQPLHELVVACETIDRQVATRWQRFWYVTWPQSLPGIFSGSALVFIPVLGMFAIPDILGGTGDIMIGNLIKDQFLGTRDWPFGSALSIMLTLAVLVIAGFFSRLARPVTKIT